MDEYEDLAKVRLVCMIRRYLNHHNLLKLRSKPFAFVTYVSFFWQIFVN